MLRIGVLFKDGGQRPPVPPPKRGRERSGASGSVLADQQCLPHPQISSENPSTISTLSLLCMGLFSQFSPRTPQTLAPPPDRPRAGTAPRGRRHDRAAPSARRRTPRVDRCAASADR